MFRIFGLVAIVLGVWWAAQSYMEHAEKVATDRADSTEAAAASTPGSTAQRAGAKVRDAFAHGTEVRERLMPEE
jgi:hypothetical protein